MYLAYSQFLEGFLMKFGSIALMLSEAIAGIKSFVVYHNHVSRHLCDDRRSHNLRHDIIAPNDIIWYWHAYIQMVIISSIYEEKIRLSIFSYFIFHRQ